MIGATKTYLPRWVVNLITSKEMRSTPPEKMRKKFANTLRKHGAF